MSENVLHRLIDAVTGKANISPHEADALHDEVTPGYSDTPLTDEEKAQLAALQAKKERADAEAAATAAAAAPVQEAPSGSPYA